MKYWRSLLLAGIIFFSFSLTVRAEDAQTVIELKNLTLKVTLPAEWKKANLPQQDEESSSEHVMFVRDNPKAAFDMLVTELGPGFDYKNKELCTKFLEETRSRLRKEMESSGYKWISDEYSEYFDLPVFSTRYEKDRVVKQNIFLKADRLFILNFLCSPESFGAEWANIEKGIKNMEYVQ